MIYEVYTTHRGGSRAAATSKIERFVIIVNGWKPLTIITIIINDTYNDYFKDCLIALTILIFKSFFNNLVTFEI